MVPGRWGGKEKRCGGWWFLACLKLNVLSKAAKTKTLAGHDGVFVDDVHPYPLLSCGESCSDVRLTADISARGQQAAGVINVYRRTRNLLYVNSPLKASSMVSPSGNAEPGNRELSCGNEKRQRVGGLGQFRRGTSVLRVKEEGYSPMFLPEKFVDLKRSSGEGRVEDETRFGAIPHANASKRTHAEVT